jgi:pantetheine-phosphate adenylyltransferase
MLEPISVRINHVEHFLHLIARHLELELIPIQDIYGPTAYNPEISALVISEETRAGANSIATLRVEKHLQPLQVYIIDVIGETSIIKQDKIASDKMSSTKIRERLSHS